MPNPRITEIIAQLPFEKKLVGMGTILMVISLFLPWYQDLDSFHTGDTFSGLTGPMYLAGFTFLVIASFSLVVMVMDYLDKKLPVFKMKTSKLHLWSGIFSFYLLFLVGSVYFHPAFGVNITLKQSGFGMFTAYAAAAFLTIGGYLEGRGKAAVKTFEKETREQPVQQVQQQPVAAAKVVHPMIERKPRENLRTMQPQVPPIPVEKQQQPSMDIAPQPDGHESQPALVGQRSSQPVESDRKVQPYRMDL